MPTLCLKNPFFPFFLATTDHLYNITGSNNGETEEPARSSFLFVSKFVHDHPRLFSALGYHRPIISSPPYSSY